MAFWNRILKGTEEAYTYDPDREEPVLQKSICTGETAAGLRDRENGRFRELMLIRSDHDLQTFMRRCGLKEKPRTVY